MPWKSTPGQFAKTPVIDTRGPVAVSASHLKAAGFASKKWGGTFCQNVPDRNAGRCCGIDARTQSQPPPLRSAREVGRLRRAIPTRESSPVLFGFRDVYTSQGGTPGYFPQRLRRSILATSCRRIRRSVLAAFCRLPVLNPTNDRPTCMTGSSLKTFLHGNCPVRVG